MARTQRPTPEAALTTYIDALTTFQIELEARRGDIDKQLTEVRLARESAQRYLNTGNVRDGLYPVDVPHDIEINTDVLAKPTVPLRVTTLLARDPSRAWSVREITDHLYGVEAGKSTLEGVRKAALRLAERGELTRVGSNAFQLKSSEVEAS